MNNFSSNNENNNKEFNKELNNEFNNELNKEFNNKWKQLNITSSGASMLANYSIILDSREDGLVYVAGYFFNEGRKINVSEWKPLSQEASDRITAIPFDAQETKRSLDASAITGYRKQWGIATAEGSDSSAQMPTSNSMMGMGMMSAMNGAGMMSAMNGAGMMSAMNGAGMMSAMNGAGMMSAMNGAGMMSAMNGAGMMPAMNGSGMMSAMSDGGSSSEIIIYDEESGEEKYVDSSMCSQLMDIIRSEASLLSAQ